MGRISYGLMPGLVIDPFIGLICHLSDAKEIYDVSIAFSWEHTILRRSL